MLIKQIRVSNVRNITECSLVLHPRLNVVTGLNGAGKSSLVESLSILATSRSFRTNNISKVIQFDKKSLTTVVKLHPSEGFSHVQTIGLTRDRSGDYEGKVDGASIRKLADITKKVPVITIYPGFYDGVAGRRVERLKLIDWGLFHVEPLFFQVWTSFQKVLKQRNSLLKQFKQLGNSNSKVLDVFDAQLVKATRDLSELRCSYIADIQPIFSRYMTIFGLADTPIGLSYLQGWSADKDFSTHLLEHRENDIQKGYTQFGCHRADVKVSINGNNQAFEVVSRGQQKMLVNGIMLAITDYMVSKLRKRLLVCIDDLPSELDKFNQQKLIDAFLSLELTQILLTTIDEGSLPEVVSGYNRSKFHVEHGLINQVQ